MAFTFLVEDGTGLPDATSYVSVADADDILSVNPHIAEDWGALSETEKEQLLSWASRYLDMKAIWKGERAVETSALRWPRSGVVDRDEIELPDNEIPQQLRIATAEMARFLMLDDRASERSQDAISELKVDVVEIVFAKDYRLPPVPMVMHDLLKGLTRGISGSWGAKPISRF